MYKSCAPLFTALFQSTVFSDIRQRWFDVVLFVSYFLKYYMFVCCKLFLS